MQAPSQTLDRHLAGVMARTGVAAVQACFREPIEQKARGMAVAVRKKVLRFPRQIFACYRGVLHAFQGIEHFRTRNQAVSPSTSRGYRARAITLNPQGVSAGQHAKGSQDGPFIGHRPAGLRALLAIAFTAVALAGCAALFYDPYRVMLVNRETGTTGVGEAPRDWTPGGRVSVRIDQRTYAGRWFHVPSDEAVLVDRWGEPKIWPDPVTDREMTGTAEMLLIAGDDDKLRCQLRFDLKAHRGTGVCSGLDGGRYDLRFASTPLTWTGREAVGSRHATTKRRLPDPLASTSCAIKPDHGGSGNKASL